MEPTERMSTPKAYKRRVLPITDEQAATLAALQQTVALAQGNLATYGQAIIEGHGISGKAELIEVQDGKTKKLVVNVLPSAIVIKGGEN